MVRELMICGAGGQGKEVAQLIRNINDVSPSWKLIGFIDNNQNSIGKLIYEHAILGGTDILKESRYNGVFVICAIGNPQVKLKVVSEIKKINSNIRFATLIHPNAVISEYAQMGEGVVISANTFLSVDSLIGNHVLINYGSSVGHDTTIGDYASIYPGARISGNVTALNCVEVGANATVLPGVSIGVNSRIGAGAVVIRSLPANCTAVGVPAAPMK